MIYFSTTTLSTVGFGDYAPRSNSERIFYSFVLIFGVAIFSLMMGIFMDIVVKWQTINASLEEGDQLSKFFGLMKALNNNVPLDREL